MIQIPVLLLAFLAKPLLADRLEDRISDLEKRVAALEAHQSKSNEPASESNRPQWFCVATCENSCYFGNNRRRRVSVSAGAPSPIAAFESLEDQCKNLESGRDCWWHLFIDGTSEILANPTSASIRNSCFNNASANQVSAHDSHRRGAGGGTFRSETTPSWTDSESQWREDLERAAWFADDLMKGTLQTGPQIVPR